jgi:excisionase family DNA binding protein
MDAISDRVISAPINEFCALSGLGRTKVYEMLDGGELDSIKIGKRRLIIIDSYRKLIERQRALASPKTTPGPSAAVG